jgi:DNA-binding NtrC family response regulator
MRELAGRVAVIEDDDSLRNAVARIIRSWGAEVVVASSAAEAHTLLAEPPPPKLILIDVRLPDGSALPVIELASGLSPAPVIVAMSGKASPDEAFQLAKRGVRKYLPKPFSIEELTAAVEAAKSEAPQLEPTISAWVGRVPMKELQHEVRRVMVKEALAQTEGSRSGAARLLHVTRQAVQQIVRSEGSSTATPPDPGGDRS